MGLYFKSKSKENMVKAFRDIIKSNNGNPRLLFTYHGIEFYSVYFNKNIFAEYNIHIYKAIMIEHFNRTLMNMLARHFTSTERCRYTSAMDQHVEKYNDSVHCTIKMTPIEASKSKTRCWYTII